MRKMSFQRVDSAFDNAFYRMTEYSSANSSSLNLLEIFGRYPPLETLLFLSSFKILLTRPDHLKAASSTTTLPYSRTHRRAVRALQVPVIQTLAKPASPLVRPPEVFISFLDRGSRLT